MASDIHNKHYTNRYTQHSRYFIPPYNMLISVRCRECITCQIVKLLNRSPRATNDPKTHIYINYVCLLFFISPSMQNSSNTDTFGSHTVHRLKRTTCEQNSKKACLGKKKYNKKSKTNVKEIILSHMRF